MRVYDCDDSVQFDELSQAVEAKNLDMINQLQAFAPDSLIEAANRGFKPPPPVDTSDTFE